MKTLFAISLLAAAVSAKPFIDGRIWSLTFHSDDACASGTTGTASVMTGGVCDSSTVIPDGTGSVKACNQDQTTEGVIFYSDSACTRGNEVSAAVDVNPTECQCVNLIDFGAAGPINSAKVVPAN